MKDVLFILLFYVSTMLTFFLPVTDIDEIKHYTAVVHYPGRYSR